MKIGAKYEDGHAPYDIPVRGHEITIFWEAFNPDQGDAGAFIAKKDCLCAQGRTAGEALSRLEHCMASAFILDQNP